MTDKLVEEIEQAARFESLVHFPEKRDPDWPDWVARATKHGVTYSGTGSDRDLALEDLLNNIKTGKPALGFGR